jgi:protoporphyrin/coproporphyrin ferrochelatase
MIQPTREGVLLVAHGTVSNPDEMEGFLTAIRRGRRPSPKLLHEMQRRYALIGGSPLLATTNAQAAALAKKIGRPVFVGMRFSRPSIEQAIAEAMRLELDRLAVVPLAPFSVPIYFNEVVVRCDATLGSNVGSARPQLVSAAPWGNHPSLVGAHAALIRESAGSLLDQGCPLILSAHSLPMQIIDAGDPYAVELAQCAEAIGAAIGVPHILAYQSQGADAGRWLGPSVGETVRDLAAQGVKRVVVAPFGFLCDHVETLYDLDVELRSQANILGVELFRVPAVGISPIFIDALAEIAVATLAKPNPKPSVSEVTVC